MKRVFLVILTIVLGLGALAGAGFVGFQMGVRQTFAAPRKDDKKDFGKFIPFDQGNPHDKKGKFHKFGPDGFLQPPPDDFQLPGFGPGAFGRYHHGGRGFGGFGLFLPFLIIAKLAFLGLFIWLGYKIFKGNGWQLSLSRAQPAAPSPDAVEPQTAKKPRRGKQ